MEPGKIANHYSDQCTDLLSVTPARSRVQLLGEQHVDALGIALRLDCGVEAADSWAVVRLASPAAKNNLLQKFIIVTSGVNYLAIQHGQQPD